MNRLLNNWQQAVAEAIISFQIGAFTVMYTQQQFWKIVGLWLLGGALVGMIAGMIGVTFTNHDRMVAVFRRNAMICIGVSCCLGVVSAYLQPC